uniref:Serine palmitoyltransferase small subunit B n=1 Tax=Anas platyrhynchos platyrhynchos TaxID=8840 RepID=A0A493T604_ANAPP
MDFKSMKYYLYWLYCQFELITCSYLMEPWEKILFYTFNITMLVMISYTAYLFIPVHISTAFQFFLYGLKVAALYNSGLPNKKV